MKKQIAASLLCLTGMTLAYADDAMMQPNATAPAQEEQVIVDQGGSLRYVPKSQVQQNAAQQPAQPQAPAATTPQSAAPVQSTQPTQPGQVQLPPGVQLTPEQQKMLTKDQQKLLNNVMNPQVPATNQ